MAIEKKVDKRSKSYRDQLLKKGFIVTANTLGIDPANGEVIVKETTLTATTKDLQKQIDKLNSRISQLETKVG